MTRAVGSLLSLAAFVRRCVAPSAMESHFDTRRAGADVADERFAAGDTGADLQALTGIEIVHGPENF